MIIKKTTEKDIDEVMALFVTARIYMCEKGNTTQWEKGYPSIEILKTDISYGNSYLCMDKEEIVGTFSFIIGEEPTYRIIENGRWNRDRAYGTIHRLAANGKKKGIARACFDFCTSQIDYIRIDTHKNNQAMQAAIKNYGFQECGTIYVRDGSERVAFDYCKTL